MSTTVRFALPSLGITGHAMTHTPGRVTFSLMPGVRGGVYFSLGSLTSGEARTIAAALVAAADAAEGAAPVEPTS